MDEQEFAQRIRRLELRNDALTLALTAISQTMPVVAVTLLHLAKSVDEATLFSTQHTDEERAYLKQALQDLVPPGVAGLSTTG